MKRAITLLAVLGFATLLSACDKCGDTLRPFGLPKSCTDTKPTG
jgi:recombinational DNA repair protein (RecF pathway)